MKGQHGIVSVGLVLGAVALLCVTFAVTETNPPSSVAAEPTPPSTDTTETAPPSSVAAEPTPQPTIVPVEELDSIPEGIPTETEGWERVGLLTDDGRAFTKPEGPITCHLVAVINGTEGLYGCRGGDAPWEPANDAARANPILP